MTSRDDPTRFQANYDIRPSGGGRYLDGAAIGRARQRIYNRSLRQAWGGYQEAGCRDAQHPPATANEISKLISLLLLSPFACWNLLYYSTTVCLLDPRQLVGIVGVVVRLIGCRHSLLLLYGICRPTYSNVLEAVMNSNG